MASVARLLRHIAGFAVGVTVFAVLIPTGLFFASRWLDGILGCAPFGTQLARTILGVVFLLPGLIFVVWSNLFLVIRGRGGPADGFGVTVSPRTEKLVESGPYRYTRNPMVFGAYMCYIACMLFLGSPMGLLIMAAFIPMTVLYLKWVEEPRLKKDFGESYDDYRRRVSMIVPMPPRQSDDRVGN
ncbi:MAG: isoprenylcysteine carboxylmethyltransferase family protein [Deltaproteobacteria bacterium]|nr:isoprenylcysteine carboxylmethyltransferase family protein [Candidatus Zymogenaceae bacterium]